MVKKFIVLTGVLLFVSNIICGAEDAPKYMKIDESKPITEPLSEGSVSASTYRHGLGFQYDFRDYSSTIAVKALPIMLVWSTQSTENGFFLRAFHTFTESSMSTPMFISDGSKTAVFDKLSVAGFGGGGRYFVPGGLFFVDFSTDFIFSSNGATRSGFDGYSFELSLGQRHDLGFGLEMRPSVGAHLDLFTSARLDGQSKKLNSGLSGLGYRLGVEVSKVF